MTNVHVICFGVCYQHRGVKVGEGGLGGGVDVIWKQSPPVSSEKWQQSTTAPCDQIQSICLVLCSGKLRASFSDGSYNIIIPRKDLSQIHGFLSEITVLEFFIYLFFIHSCMGGIWISSFTSYLLYQGCALGSPVGCCLLGRKQARTYLCLQTSWQQHMSSLEKQPALLLAWSCSALAVWLNAVTLVLTSAPSHTETFSTSLHQHVTLTGPYSYHWLMPMCIYTAYALENNLKYTLAEEEEVDVFFPPSSPLSLNYSRQLDEMSISNKLNGKRC